MNKPLTCDRCRKAFRLPTGLAWHQEHNCPPSRVLTLPTPLPESVAAEQPRPAPVRVARAPVAMPSRGVRMQGTCAHGKPLGECAEMITTDNAKTGWKGKSCADLAIAVNKALEPQKAKAPEYSYKSHPPVWVRPVQRNWSNGVHSDKTHAQLLAVDYARTFGDANPWVQWFTAHAERPPVEEVQEIELERVA